MKTNLLNVLPDHTELFIMYGATEASARLTYVPPEKINEKIDSIGIPIPGVEMKIVNEQGELLEQGQVGELVASGPNIMLRYLKDNEGTKKVLDHLGYHTGDLGYKDQEGYFFVTGRKDNQLKIGGHRINLEEIEDNIIESGMAIECVVCAIPDQLLGFKLRALVVPADEEIDISKQILVYCNQKMPKYKVPEVIKLTDTIPKKSNGKIDRALACKQIQDS